MDGKNADFGMVGLGVMGFNLVLNMSDHGFSVVGLDRDPLKSESLYQTQLLDIMVGDATLFMWSDPVEHAWSIKTPVLDDWENVPPIDFPNYAAGTLGPESAEALIARDGHSWLPFPTP